MAESQFSVTKFRQLLKKHHRQRKSAIKNDIDACTNDLMAKHFSNSYLDQFDNFEFVQYVKTSLLIEQSAEKKEALTMFLAKIKECLNVEVTAQTHLLKFSMAKIADEKFHSNVEQFPELQILSIRTHLPRVGGRFAKLTRPADPQVKGHGALTTLSTSDVGKPREERESEGDEAAMVEMSETSEQGQPGASEKVATATLTLEDKVAALDQRFNAVESALDSILKKLSG